MTLEQLKMLVNIADTGGVLAAAEAMNRTQPTVSVAIKKLENELNLQLLARDSYRASLTPAGETLCQQARIILKQSEILSGMGWGRLHEHLIAEELRSGRLVPMSINNYATTLKINICVARMMDKPSGPVAATLWEDFRAFASHQE